MVFCIESFLICDLLFSLNLKSHPSHSFSCYIAPQISTTYFTGTNYRETRGEES
jgi:hypothetical protein